MHIPIDSLPRGGLSPCSLTLARKSYINGLILNAVGHMVNQVRCLKLLGVLVNDTPTSLV